MSHDFEPSIIEYARFHGLIRHHLDPHPLQGLTTPKDFASQLDDPPELFHISLENAKVPEEKLSVDANALSLLSTITESSKPLPSLDDEDVGLHPHRRRRMKHELPLLRSDHELDMLSFASPIVPDLEHELLPLETVDDEEDEGFAWPTRCYDLPDEWTKTARSEKLQISSDAFRYLQQTLSLHLGDEEHGTFEVDDAPHKRRPVPDQASPPLLPRSPTPLPYIPSSETGQINLLSDITSPTREEAHEIERVLFEDDRILPIKNQEDDGSQVSDPMLLEIESLGQIYSPLQDIKDLPASPSPRPRLQDLKVEVPLSPPHSDQTPPWKKRGVPFSEAISELVPELSLPLPNPENNSSQDIDAFFEETIKPIAAEAERSIEQEQLQEADTTLRVTMPVMDFSLPVAPWKPRSQQPPAIDEEAIYMRTLTEMKALHFNKHIWPMSGPAERELKWTPFPAALGKVETQESIPDNGVIDRYMVPPDRVDIETLTWKSDGLRILDGLTGSDEGDLQEGSFPEEKDIISLVRKRKFELEAREDSPSVSTRNYFAEKARPSNKQITSTDSRESKTITRPGMGNVKKVQSHQMSFSNGFFAMGALEDYMSVRKGELVRPELKISNYFPSTSSTEQTNTTVQADLPNLTSHASAQASRPAIPSFPSPNFQTPSSSHHFIVSVSFLSNRPLSRQVQRLFPSAEFIERDFMLYASLHETCQDRRATSRSAVACIPAVMAMDEADMILSPSTGLIWTTLQKVKQRSLPGQQAKSAIQKRILRICPRYERLIVVISQDQKMADLTDVGACDFDHSDCEAFAEFIAFCATLQNSEVQPLFVAGGVDELARWIVALMVKHGFSDQDGIKLLLDETLWEIFLRRAGMNAYAAQAILGTLKAPDQSTDEVSDMGRLQGADFGLGAFVMMSAEERQKRFETLLGGRRLLETVSKILDTRW